MIILTRLNGEQFAVNPDLLERVDTTPDTLLTLLDGTKFMVAEPLTTVIERVRDFRASVIASARSYDAPCAHDLASQGDSSSFDRDPTQAGQHQTAPALAVVPLRRSRRS